LKGNLGVSAKTLEMLAIEHGMLRRRVALGDDEQAGPIRVKIEDMDKILELAQQQ
jgi:hypothetical protein